MQIVTKREHGLFILITHKIGFRSKFVTKHRGGHSVTIKGSIHQDVTIINKDAPNIRASKYIKQILTESKKEIKRYTVIVGYFTTPTFNNGKKTRKKINVEREDLTL